MRTLNRVIVVGVVGALELMPLGCSSSGGDVDTSTPGGGAAGHGGGGAAGSSATAGNSGSSGSSATGGNAGSAATSGNAGTGGIAGTGGTAGVGGIAGTGGTAATGGNAGTGGTAATGGSAGTAGSGGTAASGGSAGTGAMGGTAGTGATGGTAGAGGTAATGGTGGGTGGGAPAECIACHGSTASVAPPKDKMGNTATTFLGVGAHQSHLKSGPAWHHEFQCTECHHVPNAPIDPDVPTHMNGVDDVIWGAIAQTGTFSAVDATCTNNYCHGGTLDADAPGKSSNRTPLWTKVDGTQVTCGSSCHTLPPGGSHPAVTGGCETCHGTVIAAFNSAAPEQSTWVNASLHINGKVDTSGLNCTSCHGDVATSNPAPPRGTNGETLTTDRAVGAHAAHLTTSTWHRDGSCQDCHTVPLSIPHANNVVDLNWAAPANNDGANPAFVSSNNTCTNTYCHGTTLLPQNVGGTVNRIPVWTEVNGSWDSCGNTCHTNPPGGTHTTSTACPSCHTSVIATYDPATKTATWANKALHINGSVETAGLTCTSCHGDTATNNPAPPRGTNGETLTTDPAVGAHAKHLGTSTWHRDGTCQDCHSLPSSTMHSNGTVDFNWQAPSTSDGANPAFVSSNNTCTNTYCHGTTLLPQNVGGTVNRIPVWTEVNGSWDSCGNTCHTNPPGGTHPASTACATCHASVISSYNPVTKATTWNDRTLHINGIVESYTASVSCTSCHGDAATANPAPPRGPNGETLTTDPAVGAHTAHLSTSDWHRDGTCQDCHTVPMSPTHSNGVVDFNWDIPAMADGANPAFVSSNNTCTNTYCHGTTLMAENAGGTVNRTPVWTQVNGSWDSCGNTCHTNPPGGTHIALTDCPTCHNSVIATYNPASKVATWNNKSLHINGTVESDTGGLTCTSCHGNVATSDPAPPRGPNGETLTTDPAVGAHTAHLTSSSWHRDGTCQDCHSLPLSTTHSNGTVDFNWQAPSTSDGASPAFVSSNNTCTNTYCHGTTLMAENAGGTVNRTPVWTQVNGSWDTCGNTCHTNPPGGTHFNSTACPSCHSSVIASYNPATKVATWVDKSLHINGIVEKSITSCTSCHGDAATNNPAPPFGTKGETLTTTRAVGAHAAHLTTSTWHRDGACQDCHTVPGSTGHSNGLVELTWQAPSTNDGATPAFIPANNSCTNTYCHGTTLLPQVAGGTVNRTPIWTQVNGTWDACGTTCHTNPPGGTHPASTACPSCHTSVIASYNATTKTATWADRNLHIDGIVETAGLTCTSCHGDSATNNPAPPMGTGGEVFTTDPAVGAHATHLGTSTWHRDGTCQDCHTVPSSTLHSDGTVNFTWSAPAANDGANPAYVVADNTCTNTYCHGSTLMDAKVGGAVDRTPVWTQVNGSWDSCGDTCHTNPPGGTHIALTGCPSCHGNVISSFDPVTNATTWADRTLHINGSVEVTGGYHDLAGWTAPKGQNEHHGSYYFMANQQRDEHNTACTACHGANLDGGISGVSCNSANCHGTNWRSCSFCHGTSPSQFNPPAGVGGETTTGTLAVGRHVAHMTASTTHTAIACATCHTVPATNDITHALGYQPSASLATTGHHGDVTFSAPATGMTFNVATTQGTPVTARGTCTGACHSNGRGGAPVVTPYWAGGSWTVGSCGTCHAASPSTGKHGTHNGQATCVECHTAANTSTHMNGTVNVNGTSGSVTLVKGGGACGTSTTRYSCTGSCHNKSHNYCW